MRSQKSGGGMFAFGGSKKKKEEDNREDMTANDYEYMCYEITKRIN
jgi:hypothetical protein